MARTARLLERLLEIVVALLMVGLTLVVLVAVAYRKFGDSLSWYDEVASIMLAWLTYYGAALAALKRSHIGFDGLLLGLPRSIRMPCVALSEVMVFGFFAVLAWMGWVVLQVLEGEALVSLTWVPVQFTQSVIPIGALLFMVAEALSLPEYWGRMQRRESAEHAEIEAEIEAARAKQAQDAQAREGARP